MWRAERGVASLQMPSRPLVFCGIAKPDVFFDDLRRIGATPGAQVNFRDHHAYNDDDVRRLLDIARQRATNGFITTEKDALNLGPLASMLQPLQVVRATVDLQDAIGLVDYMLATIAARRPQGS
jgi:tetraacyldisaccharide 4'-kinase